MNPVEACADRRQGPVPWLTTFGDLLTLMFGFFILCIRLSPMGMKANAQSPQQVKPLMPQEMAAPADHPMEAGTSVADRLKQGTYGFKTWETVRLSENDLPVADQVLKAAVERRPDENEVTAVQDTRVSISVCLKGAELSSSTKWALARERAQTLTQSIRQLMGDDRLIRAAVTPHCDEEEGIAQVDFEQRVKGNG